jgi:hypothetical protein
MPRARVEIFAKESASRPDNMELSVIWEPWVQQTLLLARELLGDRKRAASR